MYTYTSRKHCTEVACHAHAMPPVTAHTRTCQKLLFTPTIMTRRSNSLERFHISKYLNIYFRVVTFLGFSFSVNVNARFSLKCCLFCTTTRPRILRFIGFQKDTEKIENLGYEYKNFLFAFLATRILFVCTPNPHSPYFSQVTILAYFYITI